MIFLHPHPTPAVGKASSSALDSIEADWVSMEITLDAANITEFAISLQDIEAETQIC